MTDLIERLRMQSQQEDSVEEEAIARIEQLEAILRVKNHMQQTHHDECWRQRRHHDCAVGKIERLQARVEKLEAALEEYLEYEQDFPLFAHIAREALQGDSDE